MSRLVFAVAALLVALAPALRPAVAQGPGVSPAGPSDSGGVTWSGTAGLSIMMAPMFAGASAGVTAAHRALIVRVGYERADPFWGGESLNAVSVGIGARTQVGPLRLAVAVSPAFAWGTAPYEPSVGFTTYRTAGVSAHGTALFRLGSVVDMGVGVQGHANPVLRTLGAGPLLRFNLGG